jgi:DNA uptake protein ComE-like DNA-binding protein
MTRTAARATTLLASLLLVRAWLDAPRAGELPERPVPASGAARLLHGERLDVNREPPAVLALLPRVGPSLAEAIAAARPICSLGDLDRIAGIGPVTLRALSERLTFRNRPGHCE